MAFSMLLCTEQKLAAIEPLSTASYHVGELAEKWQFPSDHLPVGLNVGKIGIACWNILNTRYIFHILSNEQGLKESMIVKTNIPVEAGSYLTFREEKIIDYIEQMIDHPTHPRSIIALHEAGTVLFEELKKRLADHMICVTTYPNNLAHGDIFIYDSNVFEKISLRSGNYKVRPCNHYMTLTLQERDTGHIYHFVQSHVPASPAISSLARKEFAQEVLSHFDKDALTIVMGDMNRSPDFIARDFEEASKDLGFENQPLQNLWIPYPTHIDCLQNASWIDNLFFYSPYNYIPVDVTADPESFFPDLAPTVSLLHSLYKLTSPNAVNLN